MRNLIFLLSILLVKTAVSQHDSSVVKKVFKGVAKSDYSLKVDYVPIDTVLNNLYHYSYDGRDKISTLGNFGFNYNFLLFQPIKFGFDTGDEGFNYLSNGVNDIILYKTKMPFARVSYISGPKKFQKFDVLFSESLNDQFNFTILYNTYGSDGFYINQETTGQRFSFTSNYKSKNSKYGAVLKYRVKSGSVNENGGIKSDSVYNELIGMSPFDADNNKLKVQVWQENAMNRYDFRNVQLTQFYRFGKQDSTSNGISKLVIGLQADGFVHDIWYDDEYADSSYFSKFDLKVNDSVSVYDKFHNIGSRNYLFGKYEFNSFDLTIGARFNFYRNSSIIKETNITESVVRFSISELNLFKLRFTGIVEKGVEGYNKDGQLIELNLDGLIINDKVDMNLVVKNTKSLPSYKMINYYNSVINWENDFNYVGSTELLLKLELAKIGLGFSTKFYSLSNYVYFGPNIAPVQHANRFNGYEIKLGKKFELGLVHLDVEVINQGVENGAPVNLSSWIWKASIYHQRFLFNDAMEVKYGIDYWQNSLYTANNYSSFTRTFNYQSSYNVGNFPYMDLFLSARIKGAQGFVNLQNIGQILFKDNYMMVPDFPMQDFGFSFGIQWDFYN